MNTSASALPHPIAAPSRSGRITISIGAVTAFGFFLAVAVPYLTLDAAVLTRYASRRWWILAHIACGSVALLTGPVQLWLGLGRRAMRAHRRLGRVYVVSVFAGALAAFHLAAHTDLGWIFGTGITGLGVAWIVTTAMAIVAIRRGSIEQHREWMIRSYVVTFAFVTFRVLWKGLEGAGIGTLQEQLGVSSWFCWAVPLLLTEVMIQGRRIIASRPGLPVGP